MTTMRMFVVIIMMITSQALAAQPTASVAPRPQAERPLHIYMVLFRGHTNIEKGIEAYLNSRGIKSVITKTDIARNVALLPGVVEDIKRVKPDLVFTWGTTVTLGIIGRHNDPNPERYVRNIPTVFTLVAEPVLAGIIPEKGVRAGVTGVKFVATIEEQFEAMRAYRPFRKVGIIYTPTEENSRVTIELVQKLGRTWGFEVMALPFKKVDHDKVTADGAPEMVKALKDAGCEWLYLPPDSHLGTTTKSLLLPRAMQLGLPSFASTEQLMETGATAGLLSRYYAVGEYTGYKIEQILVAKKRAEELPVDGLKRFSLQVSMKAAHQLNFRPPIGMLSYAELVEYRNGDAVEYVNRVTP